MTLDIPAESHYLQPGRYYIQTLVPEGHFLGFSPFGIEGRKKFVALPGPPRTTWTVELCLVNETLDTKVELVGGLYRIKCNGLPIVGVDDELCALPEDAQMFNRPWKAMNDKARGKEYHV
ncbi:hypothetical protein ABW20_dc0101873 [Dactylellina cionopaga]|nr:hypothetical protein ABW20_dc0101873 [Dactylellina cionopaga]